ncbi:MAG TPA: transposase [Kofleriaceae bacterium]|nr:transposase [Kofleriaceae bacterium]
MQVRGDNQGVLFQDPKRRGGKRRGAGRKPKGERAGSSHKARPALAARYPVHVVLRVVREIGNLRRAASYHAVRTATLVAGRREDFRIVQLSIQRTHIHLIVEADHKRALTAGMQGFQISAARHLNAVAGTNGRRRGVVFTDRYHAVIITSPRQARHTLAYVMGNWRKHGEDRIGAARSWNIDWYSSAISFPHWKECAQSPWLWRCHETYDPLFVRQPNTWLLGEGWRRHGLISYFEVPFA